MYMYICFELNIVTLIHRSCETKLIIYSNTPNTFHCVLMYDIEQSYVNKCYKVNIIIIQSIS